MLAILGVGIVALGIIFLIMAGNEKPETRGIIAGIILLALGGLAVQINIILQLWTITQLKSDKVQSQQTTSEAPKEQAEK